MKVLLIHTFGIGDFVLFTPLFEELCNQLPDAEFDFFVTQRGSISPLVNHPRVNNVFYGTISLKGVLSSVLKLRKNKYDVSITTSGGKVWKATLFSLLVAANKRIGEIRDSSLNLYTDTIVYNPNESRTFNNMQLLSRLIDIPKEIDLHRPIFVTTGEENEWANSFINSHSLNGKVILGVHPGSNGISKFRRWPMEFFTELINKLKSNVPNLAVILFIGPDEIEEGEFIGSHSDVCIAKGISLGQVAALSGKCNIFFNSDSGLGHIASCWENTHVVSIFGPADEKITGVASLKRTIIKKGLPCQPCNPENKPLKFTCNFECLHELSVDEVYEKLIEVFEMYGFTNSKGGIN